MNLFYLSIYLLSCLIQIDYYYEEYPSPLSFLDQLSAFGNKGTYLDEQLREVLGDFYQPFSVLRNHYYYDYDSNDNERFAKLDTLVSIFPNSTDFYDSESEIPVRANKYLEKLIETAKPIVIDEKPIAMIRSNGYQLFIIDTKENRELIKKYYNS